MKGFGEPKSARILQELRGLQEIPLDECREIFLTSVGNLERDHMCVRKKDRGSNGCRGDSGGPLVEQNEGSWDLAGVVSFSNGRCGAHAPLVVTRMSSYAILIWIEEVVGEDLPSRLT